MRARLRGISLRIKTPVICRDCTTANESGHSVPLLAKYHVNSCFSRTSLRALLQFSADSGDHFWRGYECTRAACKRAAYARAARARAAAHPDPAFPAGNASDGVTSSTDVQSPIHASCFDTITAITAVAERYSIA